MVRGYRSVSTLLATIFLIVLTILISVLAISYVLGVYQQEYETLPALDIRPDSYVIVEPNGLDVHVHVINRGAVSARISLLKVYDYTISASKLNYIVQIGRAWREGPYIVVDPGTELWLYGVIQGASLPYTATSVRVVLVCIMCKAVGTARVVRG